MVANAPDRVPRNATVLEYVMLPPEPIRTLLNAFPDAPPEFPVEIVVVLVPPSKLLVSRTATGQNPVWPVAVEIRNPTELAVPDAAITPTAEPLSP